MTTLVGFAMEASKQGGATPPCPPFLRGGNFYRFAVKNLYATASGGWGLE